MKENRFALVALSLIFVLLTAGCSGQAPSNAAPPAATVSVEVSPTPGNETEPPTNPPTETAATTAGEATQPTIDSFADLPLNLDGFTDLSVEQLHEILPAHDFALVNVHIPYQGELPETDLLIPYNQIAAHLAELPAKDAPIVLYCQTGPMSTEAAKTLVGLGYTRVYELEGGFNAWAAANHELLMK